VSGGSSKAEAEHLIAAKKTAYNKAIREYKKVINLRTKDLKKKIRKSNIPVPPNAASLHYD
jgi:hypothetical protein